jgi:hypothetical protein
MICFSQAKGSGSEAHTSDRPRNNSYRFGYQDRRRRSLGNLLEPRFRAQKSGSEDWATSEVEQFCLVADEAAKSSLSQGRNRDGCKIA